jgi:hypothetical protein
VAEAVRERLALADTPWLYVGVALGGTTGPAVGLVGIVDLPTAEARRDIESLVLAATGSAATRVEGHRWRRGGRPDA